MKKSLALVLAMLLILSIGLTACGTKAPVTTDTTKAPELKVLRYRENAEPPNLDPQIGTDQVSITMDNALLEGLTRSVDGIVQPGVAEKWDISADGLTYTFHLRDTKWNDGKPVTAKDFEYSILRLLNPTTASEYAFQGYYIVNGEAYNTGKITDPTQVGVKAIDDKTLEIKLGQPCKYFLSLMAFLSFQPSRQDMVEANKEAYAADPAKMVFNGPFILTEWKHEEGLVLEKNPNYWDKDRIKLDKVEISIVGDDKTAINMYEAGDFDYCAISKDFIDQYKAQNKAIFFKDGAEFYFQFNMKGRNAAIGKFLANNNFRKAFGYAIDRQAFVDATLKNGSEPATRYVLPDLLGYEKKFAEEFPLDFYPKTADAAKAKEYMDAAMKELKTTVDKVPAIEYLTDDREVSRLMAEAIQDMLLKNVGIKMEIKQVPFKQRLELMKTKDYDLVFAGWGPDYDDAMTYLDLWVIGGGHNNTNWEDKTYTDMITFCKQTTDFKVRAEKMFEAEKYLLENGPIIPVYNRQRAYAKQDYVKGLVRHFIGTDNNFIYVDLVK